MQVGKTVKRIAAISTAALMLGATLSGAFAAYNLADYAKPFLNNGVLDNTVIVVGKTAATSDVVGAIDVAAALQAEAVSKEAVDTGSAVAPTIDSGVTVAKAGNVFNYNEDIYDVLEASSLDSADMEDMLGDGTFKDNKGNTDNEEDYEQTLAFTNGAGEFDLFQDDDLAPDGGSYLHFPQQGVYTYTLEFDQPIEFDETAADADFESVSFEIQGNTYTITDVNLDASDDIDEMTLVAGDSTVWLAQDQPFTLGDHTITVVNVDENGESCGVNVDGKTVWVDQGSTEDFGGVSVGVLDVTVVHSKDYDQDTCELSLGSNEITLKEGDVVTVNGADIDGSEVTFNNPVSGGEQWSGFTITFAVGDAESGVNSDDVYLAPGQAWTDPVFGNFKIVYQGVTGSFEEMTFDASSENAGFTFMNNEGKEVKIPFFWDTDDSQIRAGDDTDAILLKPGENMTGMNGGDAQDPEGTLLWYVTSSGEARILEVDSIEGLTGANANTTTIKDWMTGDVLADQEEFTPGVATTISLGSLGSVSLNLTAGASGNVEFNSPSGNTAETKGEGTISFLMSNVTLTEVEGDETTESTLILPLGWDTTDEEIQIQNPSVSGGANTQVDKSESDDDNQILVTERGTVVEWDSDNRDKLTVMYPNEDAFANVFVAPLDAEVVGGGSGSVEADKVNPFSVGLAVLDEEAEAMTKNMIVVGGPCVNTVAAELMGSPEQCAEGFEPGKAMLKFFDRKGKAALLVAGYDAMDTVNAAYVLAQHNKKYATQFNTLGDEVELVVTDMNEVVFNTA